MFRNRYRSFWLRSTDAFDLLGALMRNSTWKRHPEPFSKSRRGAKRRSERRFVSSHKRIFV